MTRKLTIDDFGSDYKSLIHSQSYEKGSTIDGVRLIDLRLMVDDGGSFNEFVRIR